MTTYDYRESGGYGHEHPQPHYAHPEDPVPERAPRVVSRWVNVAGALTSVAMIAGLVVWGYKLAMRDLNGVPVIRAMDGPARIAPEDPGGELARHTGLAVNDVAGTGQAAPAPEKVTLAPSPEGFTDEDKPMGELAAETQVASDASGAGDGSNPASNPAVEAAIAALEPAALNADPSQVKDAPDIPVEPALMSPAMPETRPDAVAQDAAPESDAVSGVIPASVPGVSRSPRPQSKPMRDQLLAAALEQAVTKQMSAGQAEAGVVDLDPSELSAGTRLVQVGAFDTAAAAKGEWDRIAKRFDALMTDKKRVIQKASSGGRDFYRLRVAGFDDVTEARQFCAALVAERQNCIPTQAR
ncbi:MULTISPECIES: SPOR domain-containing protein [Thioclava]|uniref:SPOR domain-containing protein n=1 Tax=Thioclava nitratireducens TaxID=1915078 RepID=A0ABM6IIS7_9RHOB|nr:MULTISPECIES: SPOR domain-containing protein [Thioclava]AQS48680.1 hypothetical protein BMG03_13430 [Thioclava nitratireducens]OWY01563.1 hypothetical protein B6V76_14905 [Thioclava sp. IC9]OWY01959.1 hypothetical protein B6V75_15505 [Thioclava sp. F1Mire-8]OWY07460.1 hypothetical protein B6V74_18075 [Thioclava sp. F42-5]